MERPPKVGFGFDPAWKTLGSAVVQETTKPFKFDVIFSSTTSPGDDPSGPCFHVASLVESMLAYAGQNPANEISVCLERFVSYGNVRSSHTEEITRIIGQLEMKVELTPGLYGPLMLKAIDWKTKLCQTLVKYAGFDNPSASLDKKFSIAAAKHISTTPDDKISDHEADAICLAAYPHILAQVHAARTSGRASLG
jgi:hypothetical protein